MSNFENTPKTFGEMWTYARTGPSIYVPDIDGLLIEYPANTAPLNHKGILLEHSATNLLLYSRDMSDDQPVWDGSGMTTGDRLRNQVGADGTADAATWVRDASSVVAAYIQQSVTFNPDQYDDTVTYPHTFSVYIKKTTSATTCPAVYLAIPTEDLVSAWAINTNTGTATAISSLGTDGACVVESFGDWWRVAVTLGYYNQPDEVTAVVRLYPAASATSAPGTIAVAASSASAVFDLAQLEANTPIATSAIPTLATAQTRGAATLTHSSLDDYALPEIAAFIEYSEAVFEPWEIHGTAISSNLVDINNGSTSIILLGVRSTSDEQGNCYAYARNSGSTSDASRFFDFAASGKVAASYSQERNESSTAANGVGKTIAGDSTTHTPINIVLKARVMAYIQRVKIYMHAKSASDLATLTAP